MKEKYTISACLEENIKKIESLFGDDKTVKTRRFENQKQPKLKCCLFFVDGMVNNVIINQHIIQPIIENEHIHIKSINPLEDLAHQVIRANDLVKQNDFDEAIQSMLFGDALLFVDGCDSLLVIPVKGWNMRGIAEPDGEKVMRGPREGFNENLLVNLALLRRKVCNPNLTYKFMKFGKQTNSNACLCYISGIANPSVVSELEKRLSEVDIDATLSVSYLAELIQHSVITPFKVTGSTERPDTVAGKILEGHVALIVDGTPVALVVPHLFLENFQNLDDYYLNFYYASFGRLLRFAGFLITTLLPGLYLALVTFHQEMMPAKVLINISQSREGLPFSTLVEMLVLLVIFELIREGGSKIPSNIGQSLSIVGGLVLGQAAVAAKFVSVPIVIIVALTGITGLMIPYLSGPAVIIRFALVFLAYLAGLYGLLFGVAAVIFHLCSIDCFGLPYMSSMTYSWKQLFQDTLFRSNWQLMKYRPRFLSPTNKTRQSGGGKPFLFFLLLLLTPALLSGCGGAREIDTLAVVSGVSIDKQISGGEDTYQLTAEIINTAGGEQAPSTIRVTSYGNSIAQAFLQCALSNNRAPYWQHAKLVVVDKELAETDGISELLDLVVRNYAARFSAYLVLSDLDTAGEMLSLNSQATNIHAFDISLYIDTAARQGGALKPKASYIINALHQDGMNILLPIISKTTSGDEEQVCLSGTGVFRGDKLVGTISLQDTLYLMLLRGEAESGQITVRFDKQSDNHFVLNETGQESLSVQIITTHTRFEPSLQDSTFSLGVSIDLAGPIVSSTIPVDMTKPAQKKAVESLVNAFVTKNCLKVHEDALALRSDAFGFGTRIKKAFPLPWKQLVTDWDNTDFKKLDINIHTSASLSNLENREGGLQP